MMHVTDLRDVTGQRSATDSDLAIVGAGFAGLACAQAAAIRGVRTTVLERKSSAGEAPHTTGILVKEVADTWDIPRRLTRKISGVRLYSPSLRSLDLRSQGYSFLATDTSGLLEWLAERATAAGATLRFGAPCRGVERTTDGYRLGGNGIAARYVVACDGAKSAIARQCGLGVNRHFLAGVEHEFTDVGGVDEGVLHVFLDSRAAPGYVAWIVPGVGITQVGCAARCPASPRLDAFLDRVRQLFDFSRARVVGRRAGLIPCGGIVRPFADSRLLLLGDAAGMVSPLTAGGIHPALELGREAGVAASDFLLDGGPDPATVIRRAVPSFRAKRLLRAVYDLSLPDTLVDLLFSTPVFRSLAQAVFYHHRGLLSLRCWREIVLSGRLT